MTFVFDGTTCHVYENGVSVGDVAIDECVDNNSPLVFGGASNAANALRLAHAEAYMRSTSRQGNRKSKLLQKKKLLNNQTKVKNRYESN